MEIFLEVFAEERVLVFLGNVVPHVFDIVNIRFAEANRFVRLARSPDDSATGRGCPACGSALQLATIAEAAVVCQPDRSGGTDSPGGT